MMFESELFIMIALCARARVCVRPLTTFFIIKGLILCSLGVRRIGNPTAGLLSRLFYRPSSVKEGADLRNTMMMERGLFRLLCLFGLLEFLKEVCVTKLFVVVDAGAFAAKREISATTTTMLETAHVTYTFEENAVYFPQFFDLSADFAVTLD